MNNSILRFGFSTLLLFQLVLLISCKDKTLKQEEKTETEKAVFDLVEIKKEGKLRVLIDNSSTSYFIYKGTPMGFEYELLSLFAKEMGLLVEVIQIKDMDKVIDDLIDFKGDIIAAGFTITKDRAEKVAFSESIISSPQVLVQNINNELIHSPVELVGHEIFVRKNTSFYKRLQNLSEEIGGNIIIHEVEGSVSVEKLIEQVAKREISLTVADRHVAKINQAFYSDLHIKTPISLDQKIALAVRKESVKLLEAINNWLVEFKKTTDFRVIYLKYYGNTKLFRSRLKSSLFTSISGQISFYDELIKKESEEIGWDWRLISSIIYQESQFNHEAESWAGARGLMQLMPNTLEKYGLDSSHTPEQNIHAGIQYLKWLDEQFEEKVRDSTERIKFVLAAYNIGHGHIFDAIRLAEKYQLHSELWEGNVAIMLQKKEEADYYLDEVVYYGYCRGSVPLNYVRQILNRYNDYLNITSLLYKEE